jgi:hypothetical protein
VACYPDIVYLFENNFKQQNDADSNNNEDAGVEMLTDVTPVGRVAGQLYSGQNVSCFMQCISVTAGTVMCGGGGGCGHPPVIQNVRAHKSRAIRPNGQAHITP